jgi:hypothetical protein
MDSIEKQLAELSVQFSSLSVELDQLRTNIDEAEGKVKTMLEESVPFENEIFKYWRAREAALHEEKVALIQKEHDLHEEKMALIQKETVSETALHQKEHDLHEEKMALAPKEGLSKGKISVCLCYILFC